MAPTMETKRLDPRYFSLILDTVDHGIFTVNAKGKITSFNHAAEAITGYDAEEVMGRSCSDILRSELCQTVCPFRKSIDSRQRVTHKEVAIQTKDNRRILISVTTAPLETRTGRLLGGVETFQDVSHVDALKRKLEDKYRLDDIVSKNPEMQRLFQLLLLVADSDSTVLITGESGTGKELVARAIHNHSRRNSKPFVAVNCAAMPETLLESELFGYKKGAFTDAKADRTGRIAAAEGGTLFLDEIGDFPKTLQVKLLRFLQERQYEALGSSQTVRADLRVLVATNRDLLSAVQTGDFRGDLFFRLNVIELHLPPLRNRSEDIPLLVQHFIGRFQRITRRHILGIEDEALALLLRYSFPGNIRELENLIERAFILCQKDKIDMASLPDPLREGSLFSLPRASSPPPTLSQLAAREMETIREALDHYKGNRTKAAAALGIHRVTLVRKIKRYGWTDK